MPADGLSAAQGDALEPRVIGRTPRLDLWIFRESIVNDSPFVCVHGLELDGPPGESDVLCELANA